MRTILWLLVVEIYKYRIINLNNPHTLLGRLHFDSSTSRVTDAEQNSDNIFLMKTSCSIVFILLEIQQHNLVLKVNVKFYP